MKEILQFCTGLEQVNMGPGETLLKKGESSNKIYFLIDGEVSIEKQGVEINVVSEPGSIFGEMSVLLNLPHMATVTTNKPSKFYFAENGAEFLKNNHGISYYISKILATRLHGVTSYLVDLKNQFQDHPTHHFRMVDSVLEKIVNEQDDESVLGSDRVDDTSN